MPFCKHAALITLQGPDSPCVKVSEGSRDLFPSLVIAVLEIAPLDVCRKLASPRLAAPLPEQLLRERPLRSHVCSPRGRQPPAG